MLSIVLAAATGYAIGSLSVSYIIANITKRAAVVDGGRGSFGTRNVKEQLGIIPAVFTLCFDMAKGIGVLLIARHLFDVPDRFLAFPAAAVILGHVLPVFLRFRGGRGTAASLGMLFYLVISEAAAGRFPLATVFAVLGVTAVMCIATRDVDVVGLIASVFVLIEAPIELGFTAVSMLIMALAVYLCVLCFVSARSRNVFRLPDKTEIRIWRIAARPFALLFIPIDLIWGRRVLLFVIGILALIFIVTDLIRLGTKFRLKAVFKNKEFNRFSSMTLFLVSVFLSFLLFPVGIPYVALICITFGDFASKMIGMRFGKKKLYKSRTVEGTLGFLAGSFMFTYILSDIIALPILLGLAGCAIAAITELFSENIDDNFTVSLITGGFLTALRHFIGIP